MPQILRRWVDRKYSLNYIQYSVARQNQTNEYVHTNYAN